MDYEWTYNNKGSSQKYKKKPKTGEVPRPDRLLASYML